MLNNHYEYYVEKIVYLIVFLSCFTYAGTFELGVRFFPAEFLFFFVLNPFVLLKIKKTLPKTDRFLNSLVIVFIAIHIISFIYVVINYQDFASIMKAFKEVVRIFLTAPFLLLLVFLYRRKIIKLTNLIKSFVYSGIFTAIYAIYQYFSVKLFGKYISLLPGSSYVPNTNGRGVGTFFEGGYLVLFLGIAVWLLFYLRKETDLFSKKIYLTMQLLLLFGIYVTESTAGYVALFISVLCYFSLEFARKKTYRKLSFFRTILLVLVSTIFIYYVYNLFSVKIDALVTGLTLLSEQGIQGFRHGIGDFSAEDRIIKSLKAIGMFLANPIFGVGTGQYGLLYHDYLPNSITDDLGTVVPLNVFVEILGELGLLGIIPFAAIVISLFIRANSITRSLLIYIMLNFVFYPSYKMIFIWITLAIIYMVFLEKKRGLLK